MSTAPGDDNNKLNFEEICDASMMAIMVYHNESRQPVYINRLATETLEIPPESDSLNEVFLERLYPDENSSKARCFGPTFIQDAGFYQDIMMRRLNGINFIANLGVRYIHEGEYLMLMFQDVTFQKKLQREVQVKQQELMRSYTEILEQNAELQTLSDAKDKLITLSSHELRTPLSAIIAMTETLAMGIIEEEEERASYYNDIHREGKSLMQILNDMLELLKLTTNKMPYFIWERDLCPCVETAVEKIAPKWEHKNIRLDKKESEHLKAFIDNTKASWPIEKVLDNAFKYSPENTTITLECSETEKEVSIWISDEGPGIPDADKEKIFEEFTTLGDIDTHSKGAGLSLTIAKLICEQMGGSLKVQDNEPKGSKFQISFPKGKVLAEDMYCEENPYEDIEF